jgi:hypothetical protein
MPIKSWNPENEQPGKPAWKAVFTSRLKAEGRWPQASQRRVQLENEGMSNDDAWLKVFEEFPPLGAAAADPESASLVSAYDSKSGKRADLRRDVNWVYENFTLLSQGAVPVQSAPSAGAWALGQAAIKNPQWFYRDIAIKFLKQDDASGEGRFEDHGEQLRLVEIFEREEREARARKTEEAASEARLDRIEVGMTEADVAGFIRKPDKALKDNGHSAHLYELGTGEAWLVAFRDGRVALSGSMCDC